MEAHVEGAASATGSPDPGHPPFQGRTPWGPWAALAAAIAIVVSSLGLASLLLMTGLIGGRSAIPGDTIGIEVLGTWQVLVVALTLLAASWKARPGRVLSLGPPPAGARAYAEALAVLLAFQVISTGLEYVFIPDEMFRDLRQFVDPARGPYWLLVLAVIAVGAPLSEELLFRGFLFPALAKWRFGIKGAAVLATSLWTTLHLGYSVFGLVEVFAVGLLFSWLLWRTGSLRVTILCHALYNGLIIVVLRYAPLPAALTAG